MNVTFADAAIRGEICTPIDIKRHARLAGAALKLRERSVLGLERGRLAAWKPWSHLPKRSAWVGRHPHCNGGDANGAERRKPSFIPHP